MALHKKRINWYLLAIHFAAIPCLILGAQQLQTIRWVPFMQEYKQKGLKSFQQKENVADAITQMLIGPAYAWALAIIIGCMLSAMVVWYRRESWLIPFFLLALALASSWTHYYESEAVYKGLACLRLPFHALPLEGRLGIVGSLLVINGLLLFLLTWKKDSVRFQSS